MSIFTKCYSITICHKAKPKKDMGNMKFIRNKLYNQGQVSEWKYWYQINDLLFHLKTLRELMFIIKLWLFYLYISIKRLKSTCICIVYLYKYYHCTNGNYTVNRKGNKNSWKYFYYFFRSSSSIIVCDYGLHCFQGPESI